MLQNQAWREDRLLAGVATEAVRQSSSPFFVSETDFGHFDGLPLIDRLTAGRRRRPNMPVLKNGAHVRIACLLISRTVFDLTSQCAIQPGMREQLACQACLSTRISTESIR